MVAQLLRLKISLLGNSFRRRPWHIVGILAGLANAVAIAVVLITVLVGVRSVDDVTLLRDASPVAGALVVLGFFLAPLLVGIDDSMDPRNFALLGVPPRSLAWGLLVSSGLGVPAVVLLLVLLATVVTWSRGLLETVLALISAAILFATCLLANRVGTAVAAFLLSSRRPREFSGVLGVFGLIIFAPVAVMLLNAEWSRPGVSALGGLGEVLGWTPLGAGWAVPGDAASGAWGSAALKLLVALASVGLLWLAWARLVALVLVTPAREVGAKRSGALSWFGRLPHTPAGVIAARSITSWGRDARYWVSLIMIPVVPVLVYIPLTIAGVPEQYLTLLPVPLMCLFLGWMVHNDVAYDSTAIWLHVVSGTRGVADRIGRLIPSLVLGIPLIGLGSALSVFFYGDWGALPAMLGVSTSIFLTGLGFSSYTSARFPYPATKPGDSPFAQPQASDTGSAILQTLTFTSAIVLSSPAILGLLLGIFVDPYWFMQSFYYGVGMGLFVLVIGIWRGARAFERRGPEMLASALRA
jgi:ABC-2 type transport system permease protein